MVRSKSELVIANELYHLHIPYEYERPYEGAATPGKVRPDFSFVDPAGEVLIWEHLGMLGREEYRESWDRKRQWYEDNGYLDRVITSEDGLDGSIDAAEIERTARKRILLGE